MMLLLLLSKTTSRLANMKSSKTKNSLIFDVFFKQLCKTRTGEKGREFYK